MNRKYEFTQLNISNAVLIDTLCAKDDRGEVCKTYSKEAFEKQGICFEPVESIQIISKKNVLRGIHFQKIYGQPKLIRVEQGHIFAVMVDINIKSTTFGKWISFDMINDGKEIYVPGDCAFGSLALEDSVIACSCGSEFIAKYSDGIRWNDSVLDIDWPLWKLEGEPIISEKDERLSNFNSIC
nr:dTDP-4-dehydrorhamnose 3,5-epimerase family protein [uncultured Anaerosporobacter sp.]